MNEVDSKIIKMYAACNMNGNETTKRLHYVSYNTVRYHFLKIKKETGLDPTNFYELVKLVYLVEES